MKAKKKVSVRLTIEQYNFLTAEGKLSENLKGLIDILMNHGNKLTIK